MRDVGTGTPVRCPTIRAMTGEADDRLRGRLLGVARALSLRQVLLGTAAVMVLASGLFGGLATATPSGPADLEVGEQVHAEPFDVTVQRVRWTADLGLAEDPRGRYIGVVATLENTSDHPVYSSDIRAALRLGGLDGVYQREYGEETGPSQDAIPRVLVLADTSELSAAAPGLEYEVVFVWEQDEDEPLPTEATVGAVARTWRQSTLDDQYLWFDPSVAHEGVVAVERAKES